MPRERLEVISLNQDIVILMPKIVIPGFCPIHFIITFARQTIVDRYTTISLYRRSLYRGSAPYILLQLLLGKRQVVRAAF